MLSCFINRLPLTTKSVVQFHYEHPVSISRALGQRVTVA